jgi:shikimate dehydrogenase
MKIFTIFGNPVSHSKSPQMHNNGFSKLNIDAKYSRTRLDDGNDIKSKFDSIDISGANVTVPFKEDAYNLVDEVVGEAKVIKAVNTIIKKDGKLYGYNTDAEGFYKAIEEFGKINKALILGAGGTAKSIAVIFQKNGLEFDILNRSSKRLDFFKDIKANAYSWDDYTIGEYDLIINTTSAGLEDGSLPVDKSILDGVSKSAKYAIDVIYGKETPFLAYMNSKNIKTKDGKDMLLYQGVLAFDKFTDGQYSLDEITTHLREGLEL